MQMRNAYSCQVRTYRISLCVDTCIRRVLSEKGGGIPPLELPGAGMKVHLK